MFWTLDGAGLSRHLANVELFWFALAVLLGILANIVSAWRWLLIARHLALAAPAEAFLIAYGRGVTLNTILPGATLGGDAYRAAALQQCGNPLLRAAASVAIDRLSGLWALFVLSWFAWLAWGWLGESPAAILLAHLGGLAAAILAPWAAKAAHDRLKWRPDGAPARLLRLLGDSARFARLTLAPSLIVQLASVAALWAALNAVGAEFSAIYLLAAAAPVFLAAALPVSVGGFGTREAALAGYWALAGWPAETAVAGALLHGLAATLQGALWAPLFLIGRRGK